MKIVACIFAILSGIFGLFGGTAQSIFGAGIGMLSGNDKTMNNGVLVFCLSWVLIILGGLSLKFPKESGVGLILISIASFSLGNIFSAPFAFIAGIFDLFDGSEKKGLTTDEMYQSQITSKGTGYDKKENLSDDDAVDKTPLLNQLSQLHDLKEKKVITEEIYEQERQNILSKFQKTTTSKAEVVTEKNEEPLIINEAYNPEYEELFDQPNWLKRNKVMVFVLSLITIACLTFYFANFNSSHTVDANIQRLQDLSNRHFQKYKSKLEIGNLAIGVDSSYVEDFNGDGLLDVIKYYDLEPTDGGNYIAGQGLLLYKNTGDSLVFVKRYDSHFLFSFDTMYNSKIYITKDEYTDNDARCCPSLHTKIELTLDKNEIKERVIK